MSVVTTRPEALATAVAAVVSAALVAGSAAGGRTVLTVVLLILGLVLSTTLPRLVGVPAVSGTTVVLAGSAVLVFVVCLFIAGAGGLRWLPVAIALGLLGAFLHELARKDGRVALTLSVAGTCLGLAVLACGAHYVETVRAYDAPGVVALTAAVAAVVTAVLTLTDSDQQLPLGALVVAVVVAVGIGVYVAWLDATWEVAVAVLLTGVAAYGLSQLTSGAVRDMPAARRPAAAVASGVIPVLFVGVLPYAALWLGAHLT